MSNLERPYNILIAKAGVENTATGLGDLKEGEIILIKQDGTIYANASDSFDTTEFIYVVQGTAAGEAPKYSAKIKGASIKSYVAASYAAAVEQVSFVGNNGAAGVGSIEGGDSGIVNGQEYSLHVVIKGADKDLYSKRQLRKSFSYVADASGTEEEVVDGLYAAIVGDASFSDAAAASVKAGAVIEVSKVTDGTNFGLKFEGLAITPKAQDEYEQVIFEIGLDKGFTAATRLAELGYAYLDGAAPAAETPSANASNVPSRGTGTYQAVKDLEEFAQGFQGITNKVGFPVADYPKYAVSGMDYDLIIIEHESVHASGNLEQSVTAPLKTIIALPEDSRDTATDKAGTVLLTELNDYLASVPGAFPNVSV